MSTSPRRPSPLWRFLRRVYLMACLGASVHCAAAEHQALRVGSEVGFPPFSDVDLQGRANGFAVELFAAVAATADIPIEFAPERWDVVWHGLLAGEYDALPLVARLPERDGLTELTRAHTIGYDAFFVRQNDPPLETIEAARTRSIIVVHSDAAHHALVGRNFDSQLVVVDNLADGFRLLAVGQHDALLAPVLQGNMVLRKTALNGVIESGPLLTEYRREYSFAVRKGNTALRDRLDAGLIRVKASGDYDRLYRKWLEIYEPKVFPAAYLVWGAAVVAFVIGLMALWTWSLRRQVMLRTGELLAANAAVLAEKQRLREANEQLEQRVAARTREAVASEMRFRAMADSAPVCIWLAGPDKKCTWFNKQWLDLTGRSLQQELGDGWIEGVHPDDVARCLDAYAVCFERREPCEFEYRLRGADGEYHWLFERGVPHFGPDGDFLGYVGSCVEISERKRAEHALQEATVQAERANKAKSRLLAAASHDLRQPLSALALYLGVLSGRVVGEDAEVVANMRDCVDTLSEMLSDLLDLSKLEAGVVKPNIADFAVDEMLARIASAYGPKATAKGLFLRCAAWRIVGRSDAVLFQRMLGNLVSNAVRYTDSGGVLVGCRRRDGKLWIEVWDTGIGIPADKTATVFEEFAQLNPRSGEIGSGLGLTIVARTAALLGLEVRVRSRVGKGSLFALELPRGVDVAVRRSPSPTLPPLRIALVDDSPAVRQALVYVLRDLGHEVVAAATCHGLLTRLGGQAPDIVVSDYRLAGHKTGFGVIMGVQQAFGPVPALVITGDTDPKVLKRMARKGIRVQHKPVDLDVLNANIAELTAMAAGRTPGATHGE